MVTTNSFDSELYPTVARLATMAELCVKILHHITKNEIRQVFPLSDELRSVRAGLSEFLESRLEAYKDFIPASSMDYKLIEQLKLGVGIVRKFDHFHGQWLNAIAEPDIDELENATIEQWHIVLEKRLRAFMRWNAMVMVVRANRLNPADGEMPIAPACR